jgi:hypothetical protein
MRKKPDLPPLLKQPIRLDWLIEQSKNIKQGGRDSSGLLHFIQLSKLVALLEHLGMPWPRDYSESLKRTVDLLTHFKVVPGFSIVETGPGRKKKWPSWRYWELEVDVQLLRKKNRKMSALRACRYIAQHPQQYDNRYPTNVMTLHRHYLRAADLARQPSNAKPSDRAEAFTDEEQQDLYETADRILVKLGARESSDETLRKVYESNLRKLGK